MDENRQLKAQENLKRRLGAFGPTQKLAILTVKRNPSGSKTVRFLIVENGQIEDITGQVALAIGGRWNDKTGTYSVSGGNGGDAIDLLGVRLYNSSTRIEYYFL